METKRSAPIKVIVVSGVPLYATAFGVLALLFAVLALLIPVIGTIFITPAAIFFGVIALWGGAKHLGAAAFVILVVKLAISPIFWVNLWIGAVGQGAGGNRFLSYVIGIGMLLMFMLLFKKSRPDRF